MHRPPADASRLSPLLLPSLHSPCSPQCRPLYRALYGSKSAAARQLALDTFTEHRASYHPIAAKVVGMDLKLSKPEEEGEA